METIKKRTNIYSVLKIDDILQFGNDMEIKQFDELSTKIALRRKEEGKEVKYLVLCLDDYIDIEELRNRLPRNEFFEDHIKYKVGDISVDIVDAISIAKDDA